MTTTVELRDADGGTEISAVHERVLERAPPPSGTGRAWRTALARLAALLEG